MSHEKTLGQLKLSSTQPFALAMRALGYTKISTNCTMEDHYGKVSHVDIAVSNGRYSIGLAKNAKGLYDLKGDFMCFAWELTKEFKKILGNNVSDQRIADMVKVHITKFAILLAAQGRAKSQVSQLNANGSMDMVLDL